MKESWIALVDTKDSRISSLEKDVHFLERELVLLRERSTSCRSLLADSTAPGTPVRTSTPSHLSCCSPIANGQSSSKDRAVSEFNVRSHHNRITHTKKKHSLFISTCWFFAKTKKRKRNWRVFSCTVFLVALVL